MTAGRPLKGDLPCEPTADGASAAATEPLVELNDVSVRFALPGQWLTRRSATMLAVDRVSLSLRAGETLGILGESGSGKSTIAKLVMGMLSPTSGTVRVAGRDLAGISGVERLALQRRRQVVLQDPYSSLDPRMRAGAIVAEPLMHGPTARGLSRQAVRDRVVRLFDQVGLSPGKVDLYPHQFSGGQRQRISLARALATEPELIVLDEPTSALDASVRAQILNLLKDLQSRLGVSYIIISHDLVTVAYLASRVAVMRAGQIVEIGPTRAIYKTPGHPYTVDLLASTPGVRGDFLTVRDDPGDPVDATATAAGCRYAARCGLHARLGRPERCLDEEPDLASMAAGHRVACHFAGLSGGGEADHG